MRLRVVLVLPALLLALAAAGRAPAQLAPLPLDRGTVGLTLALRKIPITGSVLYVTAHPDDENNAVLVALSRARGLRVGLLTLTRGEGGQNAIGPELFDALGVLRTEELAAVHRYDGVEQYFSRAYEFGFTFSLEETFARWGHDETLGDVVRVVRAFRPDVMLTLPMDAPDHQHHVAAARLAAEAFRAAADPQRFPEQLRDGLRPWQARKIYQGGVGGPADAPAGTRVVMIPTGATDCVLGVSASELGALERSNHKSQASQQLLAMPNAAAQAPYVLVDSEPRVTAPESDVMDGIDISLRGLLRFAPADRDKAVASDLDAIGAAVREASAAAVQGGPEAAVPSLARACELAARIDDVGGADRGEDELTPRLARVRASCVTALALAQGLELWATASDGDVVRGQTFTVTAKIWNRGRTAVQLGALELRAPAGWSIERVTAAGSELAAGGAQEATFRVTVAADARYSQPYWKRAPGSDRNLLEVPGDVSLSWSPPALTAVARLGGGGSGSLRADTPAAAAAWRALEIERPVLLRYEGRWVGGEKQKVVNVVPALSVKLTPAIAVFPTGASATSRELQVKLVYNGTGRAEGAVRVQAPAGWTVTPPEVPLRFVGENEDAAFRFRVTAPAGARAGAQTIAAMARVGDDTFEDGYEVVAYDHIQERHLFRPATARALTLDVRVAPGIAVAYVPGVGDEVAPALEQIGARPTVLGPDELQGTDLSRFSTIVLGVRAYQRKEVRAAHARLMDYVSGGGNLVVQYARGEFMAAPDAPSPYAPYPARVTTARITDETAPVQVLAAGHLLLTTPNLIGGADWDGWVQERAIQLLDAQDARYVDLLAAADPFPKNPGVKKGLLVDAAYGKGHWTYVGLVLFRQLPAGTPGAYRLLANLVSRPRGR